MMYASMCVILVAFVRSLARVTSSLLLGRVEVCQFSIVCLNLFVMCNLSQSLCQFVRSVACPFSIHVFNSLRIGVVSCKSVAVLASLSACSLP